MTRYARTANGRFRKARWWEIFAPVPKRDARGCFVRADSWMPDRTTALVVGAMFVAFAVAIFFAGAHR